MRNYKQIPISPEQYKALKHAEELLQECMELADHLARTNKDYNGEWFECYKSLRSVQMLLHSYEVHDDFVMPRQLPF